LILRRCKYFLASPDYVAFHQGYSTANEIKSLSMLRNHTKSICLLLTWLWCSAAGTAAGAAEQAGTAAHYPPATVEMTLRQVSEHVYFVEGVPGIATDNQGFISNAGVIVTGAGVVVFDTLGTPSLAWMLLEKIRAITDEPIVRVIVSHYHADHIYGLQVFEDLDAEILAPVGAEQYLASPNATERLEDRQFTLDPWVNENTRLVYPDHYLGEGAQFSLGDVEFIVTVVGNAHSDGDMTLYVEPDRVLFSGDIIFEGRVPFLGDSNTRRWVQVLERMEKEQLVALVPGHGGVAEKPNEAISLTRRYLVYLRENMTNAVDEFIPFSDAYDEIDWSEFKDLPAFEETNRRNAYQVYLSLEAEMLSK
jgi:glyoxylase-like metal-dependent hydrolase (beta-lactamase superfamily II)